MVDPLRMRVAHQDVKLAPALAQGDALGQKMLPGQLVQVADELPGLEVDQVAAFFELVQFLQHHDGDDDVVFLKILDAGVVVQNHVGVQHEEFFCLFAFGHAVPLL